MKEDSSEKTLLLSTLATYALVVSVTASFFVRVFVIHSDFFKTFEWPWWPRDLAAVHLVYGLAAGILLLFLSRGFRQHLLRFQFLLLAVWSFIGAGLFYPWGGILPLLGVAIGVINFCAVVRSQ